MTAIVVLVGIAVLIVGNLVRFTVHVPIAYLGCGMIFGALLVAWRDS